MNEWMNERKSVWERERERKVKKSEEITEEAACSETAVTFSIDSLCPKFLDLSMHLSLCVI